MYLDGLEEEVAAEAGEDYNPGEKQLAQQQAAAQRFQETGEPSLAREPVAPDFSGMDALMSGAKRRTASPK
jgi:hypothetical protein